MRLDSSIVANSFVSSSIGGGEYRGAVLFISNGLHSYPNGNATIQSISGIVGIGEFSYIITYRCSTNQIKFYINGVLIKTASGASNSNFPVMSGNVEFGSFIFGDNTSYIKSLYYATNGIYTDASVAKLNNYLKSL